MQLNVLRADDSITHLSILGRLDVQGVQQISDQFAFTATSRRRATLVDISQVSFIASLGMGMFVSVGKALQRQSVKMVLLAPTDMVRHALHAAGIDSIIPICEAEEDALRMLR